MNVSFGVLAFSNNFVHSDLFQRIRFRFRLEVFGSEVRRFNWGFFDCRGQGGRVVRFIIFVGVHGRTACCSAGAMVDSDPNDVFAAKS